MTIEVLPQEFSVCKLKPGTEPNLTIPFSFYALTDQEQSLVCPTTEAPQDPLVREDGWRALRLRGILDFSLIGILSKIAKLLAEAGIGIFAISTYNTDYILTKAVSFDRALEVLRQNGYALTDLDVT